MYSKLSEQNKQPEVERRSWWFWGNMKRGNLMVPGSIAKGIMLTEKLPDLWIELDEF
jgi:hypothetical protein